MAEGNWLNPPCICSRHSEPLTFHHSLLGPVCWRRNEAYFSGVTSVVSERGHSRCCGGKPEGLQDLDHHFKQCNGSRGNG